MTRANATPKDDRLTAEDLDALAELLLTGLARDDAANDTKPPKRRRTEAALRRSGVRS